jgi:hypothetical protein
MVGARPASKDDFARHRRSLHIRRRERFPFFGFKRTWVTRVTDLWHNPELQMTKTELQSALAEATQTDK